jgi:uncharacterized damage-inducible protein DinB
MTVSAETPVKSMLGDAFAHHQWATLKLLDVCATLTPEQLSTVAPGTYGSIITTLRHLVETDRWYLGFLSFEGSPLPGISEDNELTIAELRAETERNGEAWLRVLARYADPEEDIEERGDGWEFHSPVGFRLAQAVHHGTDHRSQVWTALSALGIEPPKIDLWAYGKATGRTRAVERTPAS